MLVFVSHPYCGKKQNIEKAKSITRNLQVNDLSNCYICPSLAFSYLNDGDVEYEDEIELCLDILQSCDRLIVASEISNIVKIEIDFAKLVKMEVFRLDEFGEVQPFTE